MTPWLSVLIPVYNVEPFLLACLQSVFSQVDAQVEIIALDDQSSDGSFALLQELQRTTSLNFKVMQHPANRGLSAARNSLLQMATGSYIWFLDSDDALAQGSVAQLAEIVKAYHPDMVICDYEIWRCDSGKSMAVAKPNSYVRGFAGAAGKLSTDPIALFAGLYQCGKLHSWSKIFKRELWCDGLQFPEGKYFEDMVVTPRLALRAQNFYYAAEAWVWYRKRAGSILAVPSKKKVDDMAEGINDVFKLWLDKYPQMPFFARIMFIRYAVKVYFFTLIELKKIGKDDGETIQYYRNLLFKNIHCKKLKLVAYYVRNGDLLRLPKLLRHL